MSTEFKKYTFTGAHSTGKTTLLERMKTDERFTKYNLEFISSITRRAKQSGFPVNHTESEDYDLVQLAFLGDHIRRYVIKENNIFCERSLIDVCAYTEFLSRESKVSQEVYDIMVEVGDKFVHMYDKIFYIPIEFEIENDGVRTLDKEFQNGVDTYIKNSLQYYVQNNIIKSEQIITLTGSVDQRLQLILDNL